MCYLSLLFLFIYFCATGVNTIVSVMVAMVYIVESQTLGLPDICLVWKCQRKVVFFLLVAFYFCSIFYKVLVFFTLLIRKTLLYSQLFGNVLVLDGIVQVAELDEFVYHEMMANLPLNCHPDAKKVLIYFIPVDLLVFIVYSLSWKGKG